MTKINEGLLWKLATNYAQGEELKEFDELLSIADNIIRPSDTHEIGCVEREALFKSLKTMSEYADGEKWYEVELTRGESVSVNEFESRTDAFESYLYFSKQPRIRAEIYSVNRGVRSIL